MEHFNFLSDFGKIELPSALELDKYYQKTGKRFLFVLDSSVCLGIASLAKWGKKSNAKKEKIFNLIEYSQKNELEHFPYFALLKSSYNRDTLEIDYDKFEDFFNLLYYVFNTPVKKFRRLGNFH